MVTKDQVIEALKKVLDPEIGLDVYTMGLIYDIHVTKDGVKVKMTLTSIGCPYGAVLIEDAKKAIAGIKGVKKSEVELVWDPPWQPSQELRMILGI